MHGVAGLITIATSTLGAWALEPNAMTSQRAVGQAKPGHPQLAQAIETGCRQTNSMTGIYTQPSLDSASRGILNRGQTVQLELMGTGTGWARITAPIIGWVEAKYLAPSASCQGLGSISGSAVQMPAAAPAQTSVQASQAITVVCEVLPTEGLVVRSEPSIASNTALHTIPKGAHQFQFTNNHLTVRSGNLERQWVYINAPHPGWISLGVVGASFNLGGRECG